MRKDQAQLVQEQISSSSRSLGRVKTKQPKGVNTISPDRPDFGNIGDVIWYKRTFNAIQGRCSNYNALTSGFGERGAESGYCSIVENSANQYINGINGAFKNWLRTGACTAGKFSTCSGYQYSQFYVPSLNDFRKTSETVFTSQLLSDRGGFTDIVTNSGYNAAFSIEVKRTRPGYIPLSFSTAESVAIFLSGHLKYSSGNLGPNSARNINLSIDTTDWVRLDVTYYSHKNNGRISIDPGWTDYVDSVRVPTFPSGVSAWYGTFAARFPGEGVGKWSYIHTQIGIPGAPQTNNNAHDIEYVEVDWKPDNLFNSWQRVRIPVAVNTTTVSGIFRVPSSEQISVRARSVNHFGDPGPWHTPSGIMSAAGNVRPAQAPDQPFRRFEMSRVVGGFGFDIVPSNDEDWRDFILVSGGAGNTPMATALLTVQANPGDTSIKVDAMPEMASGHMLTLTVNGAYNDSGQAHMIRRIEGTTVFLEEPISSTVTAPNWIEVWRVAKITRDTNFTLIMDNKREWYFNIAARNHNGGISVLASGASAWVRGSAQTIATDELFEDGGNLLGKNLVKNGSFELPKYNADEVEFNDYPLSWWYAVSGDGGPHLSTQYPLHGRQAIYLPRTTVSTLNLLLHAGFHNGIWQDIYTCSWASNYTFKANVHVQRQLPQYKISGLYAAYHEVWEIPVASEPIRDFAYGSLPAGSAFLTSGTTLKWVATSPFDPPDEDNFYLDTIKHQVLVSGTSNVAGTRPLVRLCVYRHPDCIYAPSDTGSYGIYQYHPSMFLDEVYFGKLSREAHPFDEDLDGRRFTWEGIRTNIGAASHQGESLYIDERYGLMVERRKSNPTVINKAAPSTLLSVTISGQLSYPRLVGYWPNMPSLIGCPTHYTSAGTSKIIATTGSLIVPSGRAIVVEADVRRTFYWRTDTEILAGTSPVTYIVPSGGTQYRNSSDTAWIWFDPGYHSVLVVKDILYDVVGGSTGLSINKTPIVADYGDLHIRNMRIACYTAIAHPTGTVVPGISAIPYWHAVDVKMWETEAPFVGSGWNTTGGNNVGYNHRYGLTNIAYDGDGRSSTSVYK